MMATLAHPPHLAALVSIETGDGAYDGFFYRGGALQKWLTESWIANALALDTLERLTKKRADVGKWSRELPASVFPVFDPAPAATSRHIFRLDRTSCV